VIEQVADTSSSFSQWFSVLFMATGCFYAGWMARDKAGWKEFYEKLAEVEELKNRYLEKLGDKK